MKWARRKPTTSSHQCLNTFIGILLLIIISSNKSGLLNVLLFFFVFFGPGAQGDAGPGAQLVADARRHRDRDLRHGGHPRGGPARARAAEAERPQDADGRRRRQQVHRNDTFCQPVGHRMTIKIKSYGSPTIVSRFTLHISFA